MPTDREQTFGEPLEACDCGSAQEDNGWACRCSNPPCKRTTPPSEDRFYTVVSAAPCGCKRYADGTKYECLSHRYTYGGCQA